MVILLEFMRKRRGMSQIELARKSGVPQGMISEIETGTVRFPRVDTMGKLARALKCTVDDLIQWDDEQAG